MISCTCGQSTDNSCQSVLVFCINAFPHQIHYFSLIRSVLLTKHIRVILGRVRAYFLCILSCVYSELFCGVWGAHTEAMDNGLVMLDQTSINSIRPQHICTYKCTVCVRIMCVRMYVYVSICVHT